MNRFGVVVIDRSLYSQETYRFPSHMSIFNRKASTLSNTRRVYNLALL